MSHNIFNRGNIKQHGYNEAKKGSRENTRKH